MSSISRLTIRQATRDDLQAVLAVHDRHKGQPTDAPTAVERETWDDIRSADGLTTYCASVGDDVVGTATLCVMPNLTYDCAPTAFIEAVVVIPEYRRQGIATALLRQILADAAAAGCNKIQLLSHKRHASDGAHVLYVNLGFVAEAEGFRTYLKDVPEAVAAAREPEQGQDTGPS